MSTLDLQTIAKAPWTVAAATVVNGRPPTNLFLPSALNVAASGAVVNLVLGQAATDSSGYVMSVGAQALYGLWQGYQIRQRGPSFTSSAAQQAINQQVAMAAKIVDAQNKGKVGTDAALAFGLSYAHDAASQYMHGIAPIAPPQ